MFPLVFRGEVNRQETRVMGLSSSEDRMIVAGVVLACMIPDCDGRSDGQTVGQNRSWLRQRSAQQAMLTRCQKLRATL